jgi:hypothetical protein
VGQGRGKGVVMGQGRREWAEGGAVHGVVMGQRRMEWAWGGQWGSEGTGNGDQAREGRGNGVE